MKQFIILTALSLLVFSAYAAAPIVANVVATPGTGQVAITYDLTADGNCHVTLVVSEDSGANYNIFPTATSGDIGNSVSPGNGKQMIWNPAGDEMTIGVNYRVKVIARDNPVDTEDQFQSFIKVEGGTFNNGTSDVTISTFFIDKYEVTQAEYEAVMGTNPSNFSGNPTRPVEQVSWFKTIEYCNRRSMQEGLTPAYSYSTYGTNPDNWPSGWYTNDINHTNVACNWSANGYRLPTEMEWMFAAKGGNSTQGYTYSGSNTVGDVAWYSSNSGNRTHDVGTKDPNELLTYDMSGNVWEWCWDIWGSYPSGAQTNPTGAASGSWRIVRGGSWVDDANLCTVSSRNPGGPTVAHSSGGFRILRTLPATPEDNTVTDIDGNVYETVQIGDQIWMAENLKVTHYRNGDPISNVTDDSAWAGLSTGAYCVYNNTPANAETYGNLYNWYAVDDLRGLAPEGWHVPTDNEIKQLEMALGMSEIQAYSAYWRGTNEGSKLTGRADLWTNGNLENNPEFDTSGLCFLPGGYRYSNGTFSSMNYYGYLWSSTADSSTNAWYRRLYYDYTTVSRNSSHKRGGFSVRCVRD